MHRQIVGVTVVVGIFLGGCGAPITEAEGGAIAHAETEVSPHPFVNEEVEPTQPCGFGNKWTEWSIFMNGKDTRICCPPGQMPTGNDPASGKQVCQVSLPQPNCGMDAPSAVYCSGTPPFKVCCPTGHIGTCDPAPGHQQCFRPQAE
jgi:hypothetical protein